MSRRIKKFIFLTFAFLSFSFYAATDDGEPALTRYQRVIIHVKP